MEMDGVAMIDAYWYYLMMSLPIAIPLIGFLAIAKVIKSA